MTATRLPPLDLALSCILALAALTLVPAGALAAGLPRDVQAEVPLPVPVGWPVASGLTCVGVTVTGIHTDPADPFRPVDRASVDDCQSGSSEPPVPFTSPLDDITFDPMEIFVPLANPGTLPYGIDCVGVAVDRLTIRGSAIDHQGALTWVDAKAGVLTTC